MKIYDEFIDIVFGEKEVTISPERAKIINESYLFLKEFAENKIIYGVNTGFGPMAQYRIDTTNQLQLAERSKSVV